MLNPDRIRRMIAANTVADAAKILFECGYNEQILTETPWATDKIIFSELERTLSEFRQLCKNDELVYCVMARFFYHNAAALYNNQVVENANGRSKDREATLAESLYPMDFEGISVELLRSLISKRSYNSLPEPLQVALAALDKMEAATPQVVEVEINRALFTDLFARLRRMRNRAITNYFVASLDIQNMRTFAKVKMQGGRPDGLFIEGGRASEVALMAIFERDPNYLRTALAGLGYDKLIDALCDGLYDADLTRFENLAGAFLVEMGRVDADDSFKLNMTFAWFIKKMEELRIVKIILMGKKFGRTKDELREELRGVL